ncbi:B-cell receptor CD22 isoform X2 [Camelus bactrianus]|uniref:B-cell receptor CD22 isoform X2 n=2 Tax=Camelus bactrianus TaxID=9837 RepID=A0AC58QUC9_CAMBA
MQPDMVLPGSGKRGRSSVGKREKLSARYKRPDGSKTNSSQPRLLPRHSIMHLLGPSLLLLEYLALSDSALWTFYHPKTIYAWDGACAWIPCNYRIPGKENILNHLTLYHNPYYNTTTKDFEGAVLYSNQKAEEFPPYQERVQFLGNEKGNCTLYINPVKVSDSGQLGLRIMTVGPEKWMESIGLNVSEKAPPPHIQLPPEIQELQEVTVTCSLNFACFGYQIHLQWSLEEPAVNATTLAPKTPPTTHITLTTKTISSQSNLMFQPQWTHHGKNLTCQLWDPTKQHILSEKTVQLDVKHLPKLKIQVLPQEATVMEGASVTMECQVISSNPQYWRISWLKNGNLLPGTKNVLSLPEVTRDMSGKYQCEALNVLGTGKSEGVDLQVLHAPEPSRVQLSPSTVQEGNQVKLTCVSRANPPPTNYTWYYNGIEMPGWTNQNFQIPEALLRHAGRYSCLAENSLGLGQVGQEAELDVQYPPKEVTTVIQNPVPIREGDSVTLLCTYNSSNPRVTRYEWDTVGSRVLPAGLTIQNVAWDTGPVKCAACNQWCFWSPPVNLDVQYAPKDVRVLISPRTEIYSGHRVLLQCDFSSSHPADIHFFWKKNGVFLEEGKDLSFDSISPEDAGSYNCLVNNSIGQTESKAWAVQVLYAPRRLHVSVSPKDGVIEGGEAVLTCESDANPPISHYAWFDWNNQDLHHYNQMLRLNPVKVQQSGAYWCQGTNRLGRSQSPPSTLTVYYSAATISRRAALGVGFCLAVFLLAIWGVKLQRSWKRIQSQQRLQENSSGQSFFVRNIKARRTPQAEGPHSLGCYNPVMEDAVSYAALRFPPGETDSPRLGDAGTSEMQGLSPNRDDTVTYSVVQKSQLGDYENVTPSVLEDEGIHYSELVHFGAGERPLAQEGVEYVILKH